MPTRTFHDFDEFAESIRGVESRMMLRNPQKRCWKLSGVELPGIQLQLGQLGSGNIAAGEFRSDGYMLYLPLTNTCEYSANGVVLERGALAILEPGCEFCISTEVGHDWCAVTVPAHVFPNRADPGRVTSASEQPAVRVTRADRAASNRIRRLVHQVIEAAAICAQFESSPAATSAVTEVLKAVSKVFGQEETATEHRKGRPQLPRQEIVRCAMDLLEQRDGELVLVADLAAAADVSERTLRTTFNQYFGVSPIRYLQLRRLHRVCRLLSAANPEEVNVSTILIENGEWEFGRFAARYHRLFGELPCKTLRSKRQ